MRSRSSRLLVGSALGLALTIACGGDDPKSREDPDAGGASAGGSGGGRGGAGGQGGSSSGAGGSGGAAAGGAGGSAGAGGSGGAGTGGAGGSGSGGAGGGGADASPAGRSDGGPPGGTDGGGAPSAGTLPAGSPCKPGETYGDPLPQSREATMVRGGFSSSRGPSGSPPRRRSTSPTSGRTS